MTDTFERDRDAEFFRERGFGLRIGFGKTPALLVVDIVKAFSDPQRMLGAELGPQIVATNQLLDVAHDKSVPVIFSTVAYEDSNFKDAGVWALKQKGVATLVAGSTAPSSIRGSTIRRAMPSSPRNTPHASSAPT
jgi:maleamate amidohydrolase